MHTQLSPYTWGLDERKCCRPEIYCVGCLSTNLFGLWRNVEGVSLALMRHPVAQSSAPNEIACMLMCVIRGRSDNVFLPHEKQQRYH